MTVRQSCAGKVKIGVASAATVDQIRSVVQKFQKWLVVVLLTIAVGGHWAILQSAAWVGMIVKYAENASLAEALSKTFDGQHPCQICKFVDEGKKAERQQPLQKLDTKIDFYFETAAVSGQFFASPVDLCAARPALLHAQFRFSPPVPPPRGA